MKHNNYLLTLFLFLFSIGLYAQKSEALLLQYQYEYQTFKEFIIKSLQYKGDTTIDIKFYHIDIEIGITSPYIGGSVITRLEPISNGLNELHLDLNSALHVDSISSPCVSFEQVGDARNITLDNTYNPGDLIDLTIYYHGIPVMAVTAVGKELEKRDARYLGLCCRIAAEFGAKVVKTYWCKDFDKVVEGCPVPVVMAGGPKCETEQEVFEFVHDGMTKGAIGLNLGRNVWQHEYPVPMIKALRAIIHANANVKDAVNIYQEEKGKL